MKTFLPRYYHFAVLGVAVLIAAASTVFLFIHFSQVENSLKGAVGNAASGPYTPDNWQDSTSALSHLKNAPAWTPREDGASPYVSRPYLLKDAKLIDPMTGSEPLYPPVPNQWLIDHHLDYTDMNILDRDPLRKGFTVREEFEAGTDPKNPNQFPSLCSKLSYQDAGIRKTTYLLEFLGEEEVTDDTGKSAKMIEIKPAQPLPNPAKGNRPDTSTRHVLRGNTIPGAPFLKVIDIAAKTKILNDTEYDVSELSLQNTLTGERITLVKKNPSREYKKPSIELIESIQFDYQLSGGTPESFNVERGKEFQLASLDKNYTETYKLVDISKDGVVLQKDGKSFTVKPASSQIQNSAPIPTP
jgi:hypothetical protein